MQIKNCPHIHYLKITISFKLTLTFLLEQHVSIWMKRGTTTTTTNPRSAKISFGLSLLELQLLFHFQNDLSHILRIIIWMLNGDRKGSKDKETIDVQAENKDAGESKILKTL